jgi:hypothetical protein
VSQELDVDARLRLALRILGWVGTTMWAGFWLTWGLVMAAISSTTAGVVMAGLACLPCLPFWIFEVRRYPSRAKAGRTGTCAARPDASRGRVAGVVAAGGR